MNGNIDDAHQHLSENRKKCQEVNGLLVAGTGKNVQDDPKRAMLKSLSMVKKGRRTSNIV